MTAVRRLIEPWLHGRIALALLAGVILPLGFAPLSAHPLAIVSVAAVLALIEAQPGRVAARLGFAYGFSAFLAGTYWLYISVHHFGQAPLYVALPVMLSLVLIMAAWYALFAWCCVHYLRGPAPVRWLLSWPAAWMLVEWLRGWVASGFPWLSLGYSQTDSVLAGFAPLGGIFAVSWAVVLSAGCALTVAAARGKARWIGLGTGAAVWLAGALLQQISWTLPEGEPARVTLVQGNVAQDRKWLPENRQPTLDLYRDLTHENLDSELIVWPEAALPALVSDEREYLLRLAREAQAVKASILLGVLRLDRNVWQVRNSLLSLGADINFYDKRHLVPFGEYFPVPDFVRNWLRLLSLPYSDIAPGADGQEVLRAGRLRVAPTICFEDAFGGEQLEFLPEANVLVNVSNDAWFGDSVAPHQHLQIARMRAIESRRFMIRSTNTGISAVIGPHGEIRDRGPQFQTTVLRSTVQPLTGATPYVRVGNTGPVLTALFAILVASLAVRRFARKISPEGSSPDS